MTNTKSPMEMDKQIRAEMKRHESDSKIVQFTQWSDPSAYKNWNTKYQQPLQSVLTDQKSLPQNYTSEKNKNVIMIYIKQLFERKKLKFITDW